MMSTPSSSPHFRCYSKISRGLDEDQILYLQSDFCLGTRSFVLSPEVQISGGLEVLIGVRLVQKQDPRDQPLLPAICFSLKFIADSCKETFQNNSMYYVRTKGFRTFRTMTNYAIWLEVKEERGLTYLVLGCRIQGLLYR